MSPEPTYTLNLEPVYLPSVDAPEEMAGRVSFEDAVTRRVACRVEVRAAWTAGGDIAVAEPDPLSLPGLSQEEIQERARAFVAEFRDDKLSGRITAGGDASEP